MSVYWVPLLLFAVGPARSVLSENDTATDSPGEGSASDIVRKVIAKGCARKYTMMCFKMDMVNLVDLLSEIKSYQIFPGVSVVSDNATEGTFCRNLIVLSGRITVLCRFRPTEKAAGHGYPQSRERFPVRRGSAVRRVLDRTDQRVPHHSLCQPQASRSANR